jgi:hypothetical protein
MPLTPALSHGGEREKKSENTFGVNTQKNA